MWTMYNVLLKENIFKENEKLKKKKSEDEAQNNFLDYSVYFTLKKFFNIYSNIYYVLISLWKTNNFFFQLSENFIGKFTYKLYFI